MKTTLIWKKRFFSSTYEIFKNEMPIGSLKQRMWSHSADGEINGHKYSFLHKGFFNRETQISDQSTDKIIATITYNFWGTKAWINYYDYVAQWEYTNGWQTRWWLTAKGDLIAQYYGNTYKGVIEYEVQDDLNILTGLFIASHFKRISSSAVVTAVLIPIFATT